MVPHFIQAVRHDDGEVLSALVDCDGNMNPEQAFRNMHGDNNTIEVAQRLGEYLGRKLAMYKAPEDKNYIIPLPSFRDIVNAAREEAARLLATIDPERRKYLLNDREGRASFYLIKSSSPEPGKCLIMSNHEFHGLIEELIRENLEHEYRQSLSA